MRITRERSLVVFGILLPGLSTAWSLPQFDFRLPFASKSLDNAGLPQEVLESVESVEQPLRIAIIGAGAAGSSAAFWIAKAKERHEQNVHVDVYEQSGYVGGRTSTSTYMHPFSAHYTSHPLFPCRLNGGISIQ